MDDLCCTMSAQWKSKKDQLIVCVMDHAAMQMHKDIPLLLYLQLQNCDLTRHLVWQIQCV